MMTLVYYLVLKFYKNIDFNLYLLKFIKIYHMANKFPIFSLIYFKIKIVVLVHAF